jgi:cation transport ATPase
VEQQPGSGVSGVVCGHNVAVGSSDWLTERSVVRRPAVLEGCCMQRCQRVSLVPDDPKSKRCLSRPHLMQVGSLPRLPAGGQQGSTTVAVSIDGHMAAAIQIADELRTDSRAAVQQLRAMGIRPVLLSGEPGSCCHWYDHVSLRHSIQHKDGALGHDEFLAHVFTLQLLDS